MRQIVYKIAGCEESMVKQSLPADFITEWSYLDLQPENFLEEHPGWSVIDEDQFEELKQSANDPDKIQQFREQTGIDKPQFHLSLSNLDERLARGEE